MADEKSHKEDRPLASPFAMPLPLFAWSPARDQPAREDGTPASQFSRRFSALHSNVRSIFNGSSVYSNSPALPSTQFPKSPRLGLFRSQQSLPRPLVIPNSNEPRFTTESGSPLRPPPTAGSYMRAIAPLQDLRTPEPAHDRHPADVPLDYASVDPETQQLQDEVHGRRRRRHHRRRRKHRHTHWVRRRRDRNISFAFMKSPVARSKLFALLISGLLLATILAVYLSLALTRSDLGQEIHVLFIMVIVGITIFFCHSLVRLFMLALHPPEETPRIPAMTGPDGFRPVRPIRVHVARDEDLGNEEADIDTDEFTDDDPEKKPSPKIAPPPPAYGLWRSSVRVDPNLLHWQRISTQPEPLHALPPPHTGTSRIASVVGTVAEPTHQTQEQEHQGPRPPSYISDDGVSYLVEAAPRSTVSVAPSHSGVSDIHPAWRPGYAMSEVHIAEWPAPLRI